ncbi:Gfo/Idh/MocA family protein [Natrialbaceae archaeon GCM10025810]|uniref:Gfo/Idh/MocA family protein n=1 Tax=Halovalidus salilacus TaxID=3075124 RepID=UPI00361A2EDA
MNYAVIGTGYWGSNHARVGAELLDEGAIDSLVFCDADEDRVSEVASQYDVEYVTESAELVSGDIDAATIATPSPTHRDIAVPLLEAGVDLLVEKPLALDSEDAWEIVETAKAHDRVLAVGHIFRHHPALSNLKSRIDRGELGDIKYLHTNRYSFRAPRRTAGTLYSLAVHDIDISNYLLESTPDRMYCQLDSNLREEIDETATVVLEYDGATAVLNESWQVPVFGKRRDLTVVGSERAAYVDYLEDNVVEIYDSKVIEDEGSLTARENGRQVYEVENREPLRAEVVDFLDAVNERSAPRAPGNVGAATVELLQQAIIADETNQVVSIDPTDLGYSWSR